MDFGWYRASGLSYKTFDGAHLTVNAGLAELKIKNRLREIARGFLLFLPACMMGKEVMRQCVPQA
ncbi:hypothetical protein QN360_03160 [Glaciimonas sp. CA11.2]|uniref:hypothetical protein n=1 Tax=unclassified Glaciimonas TaxID=2644401 RepID=UPI002AB3E6D1|nr:MULTISPECIES: hypothetical protein [unclassified Glaciimonas]MDY7545566.1 hypothetical protein [Glaciimonas sp. CA11.2]MEB0012747.1 hypothetical protein [Glaciimonas sp. Cout2]MEB0161902.1 hypothetical protein [Glaciimonas sp. CA11.2]